MSFSGSISSVETKVGDKENIKSTLKELKDSGLQEPPAEKRSYSDVHPPPDGGFRAWAQVVAGHMVVAMTWGYSSSFGVFQNYYEATMPNSPSDISWIGGFQIFLLLFVSPLSGRATDAGMARLMISLGTTLLVIGTFMTSLATEYWQVFLAQGVCIGIGQGLMWIPSVTLVSSYFKRYRVLAVTTAGAGAGTGGIIFPALIQYLIPEIGYCWAVRVMGFVVLVMSIIAVALLRPHVPPRKSGPWVEWTAFKEPAYMLFTLGVFLLYWALYFAFFYVQVNATDKLGLSQTESVNLLIVINAMGIPTRPILGYLSDRYTGPFNCFIPSVALCCIMMFSWIGVQSVADLYVFAVFFGIASAAAVGLFVGIIPFLTKDLDKVGTRVGIVLLITSLGPLTGPSVAGALIESTGGDYLAAQIWAGATLLVGTVALVWARFITSGPHFWVKL